MPRCHVTHRPALELFQLHFKPSHCSHLEPSRRHDAQELRASSPLAAGTSLQIQKRDSMRQHIYHLPILCTYTQMDSFHSVTSRIYQAVVVIFAFVFISVQKEISCYWNVCDLGDFYDSRELLLPSGNSPPMLCATMIAVSNTTKTQSNASALQYVSSRALQ